MPNVDAANSGDVKLVYVQAKDQEELRQLLDSLKSSDVISVQVFVDGLYIRLIMISLAKYIRHKSYMAVVAIQLMKIPV